MTAKPFPLQDPNYQPKHIPVNGIVPPVVAKWGPRSQLRWFMRFAKEVFYQTPENRAKYGGNDFLMLYPTSVHHRGFCCHSCEWEFGENTGVMMDDWCCCHDKRMKKRYSIPGEN